MGGFPHLFIVPYLFDPLFDDGDYGVLGRLMFSGRIPGRMRIFPASCLVGEKKYRIDFPWLRSGIPAAAAPGAWPATPNATAQIRSPPSFPDEAFAREGLPYAGKIKVSVGPDRGNGVWHPQAVRLGRSSREDAAGTVR